MFNYFCKLVIILYKNGYKYVAGLKICKFAVLKRIKFMLIK